MSLSPRMTVHLLHTRALISFNLKQTRVSDCNPEGHHRLPKQYAPLFRSYYFNIWFTLQGAFFSKFSANYPHYRLFKIQYNRSTLANVVLSTTAKTLRSYAPHRYALADNGRSPRNGCTNDGNSSLKLNKC